MNSKSNVRSYRICRAFSVWNFCASLIHCRSRICNTKYQREVCNVMPEYEIQAWWSKLSPHFWKLAQDQALIHTSTLAYNTTPHHSYSFEDLSIDSSSLQHIYKMASRIVSPALRTFTTSAAFRTTTRSFQTSSRRCAEVITPLPVRKPVGAFRGG